MTTLLLVGCGKMGVALLGGWLARGWAAGDITVVEPDASAREAIAKQFGVGVIADGGDLAPDFSPDVIVLAVKPQIMDQVLAAYVRFQDSATFVSIAAGRSLASFSAILGDDAAVVRAMPNTPAQVGRGISVVVANDAVNDDARESTTSLLEAVGDVKWIDDENLMDAVTAVSGSGPAYVFLLTEALAHGGVMAGLPVELAAELARATVAGSGELLHRAPESAETLRQNVTSKGGTTAAALDVLMRHGAMKELLVEAVDAATKRSRELSG